MNSLEGWEVNKVGNEYQFTFGYHMENGDFEESVIAIPENGILTFVSDCVEFCIDQKDIYNRNYDIICLSHVSVFVFQFFKSRLYISFGLKQLLDFVHDVLVEMNNG